MRIVLRWAVVFILILPLSRQFFLEASSLEESDVTYFLTVLAWAYLEAGDVTQATTVVQQALARIRPENMRAFLVDALRVQATVACRQGRWDEAASALEEGLEMAQAMPYPYAEARLLHVYGEMHLQNGEPQLAREHLEAALAIFQRLGARKDVERVEQTLLSSQAEGTERPGTGEGA
jgi:Tfp pilus assembly protein PilF